MEPTPVVRVDRNKITDPVKVYMCDKFFNKRHVRADKVPYLNIKLVIFDANLYYVEKPCDTKVVLRFGNSYWWAENGKVHRKKVGESVLGLSTNSIVHYPILDMNIGTFRDKEDPNEINNALYKIAAFNLAWEKNSENIEKGTAHYVHGLLDTLGLLVPGSYWMNCLMNVVNGVPFDKEFIAHDDLFYLDSKDMIRDKIDDYPEDMQKVYHYLHSDEKDGSIRTFQIDISKYDLEYIAKFMMLMFESVWNYFKRMEWGWHTVARLCAILKTNYEGWHLEYPELCVMIKKFGGHGENSCTQMDMYNYPRLLIFLSEP